MRCVKVENGIVVNSAIWDECPDGWIESDAGKGWHYYEESNMFSPPAVEVVEPTTEEQIIALEATQTPRMLRTAALGDEDSIAMLQSIEDQISQLRMQLN